MARFFQRSEQILRRFFGHSVETGELFQRQVVEVRYRIDQFPLDQLLDQLVAEALDVKRLARRVVFDGFLALRRAEQPADAAVGGLPALLQHFRTADRAAGRSRG